MTRALPYCRLVVDYAESSGQPLTVNEFQALASGPTRRRETTGGYPLYMFGTTQQETGTTTSVERGWSKTEWTAGSI